MEFKDIKDEFSALRQAEETETSNRIKFLFSRKFTALDLSNNYLYEKSSKLLLKMLKQAVKPKRRIKSIVLQNCMITSKVLTRILKQLSSNKTSVINFDISNNKLLIEPVHAEIMSNILSLSSKPKNLILKGNNCSSPLVFSEIFSREIYLNELNLYDSKISSEALNIIANVLSLNHIIIKLNLGFNNQAFSNYVDINTFAHSISNNCFIQHLSLCNNFNLGKPEHLRQLCDGIKTNSTLRLLELGGNNIDDDGIKIILNYLLKLMPLPELNLERNKIRDFGFLVLMDEFPNTLTHLNISYNFFEENSALTALSQLLKHTKSLRKLNISSSFDLKNLNDATIDELCEALAENDSVCDFFCEGIKISKNPDEFCEKLNKAIDIRKLSLTYKVSAVKSDENYSSNELSSSSDGSVKVFTKAPSNLWLFGQQGSTSFTERKDYIDSPDQEPIIDTSRQFTFSESFE